VVSEPFYLPEPFRNQPNFPLTNFWLIQFILSNHLKWININPNELKLEKYPIKEAWVVMEQYFDLVELNQGKYNKHVRGSKRNKEEEKEIENHPMHIHSS